MTPATFEALRQERRLLEDAQNEAMAEVDRLELTYRELRSAGADINALIPARMLLALARIHLVNVRSEWHGVRDRLNIAQATVELAEGTVTL